LTLFWFGWFCFQTVLHGSPFTPPDGFALCVSFFTRVYCSRLTRYVPFRIYVLVCPSRSVLSVRGLSLFVLVRFCVVRYVASVSSAPFHFHHAFHVFGLVWFLRFGWFAVVCRLRFLPRFRLRCTRSRSFGYVLVTFLFVTPFWLRCGSLLVLHLLHVYISLWFLVLRYGYHVLLDVRFLRTIFFSVVYTVFRSSFTSFSAVCGTFVVHVHFVCSFTTSVSPPVCTVAVWFIVYRCLRLLVTFCCTVPRLDSSFRLFYVLPRSRSVLSHVCFRFRFTFYRTLRSFASTCTFTFTFVCLRLRTFVHLHVSFTFRLRFISPYGGSFIVWTFGLPGLSTTRTFVAGFVYVAFHAPFVCSVLFLLSSRFPFSGSRFPLHTFTFDVRFHLRITHVRVPPRCAFVRFVWFMVHVSFTLPFTLRLPFVRYPFVPWFLGSPRLVFCRFAFYVRSVYT